MNLNGGNIRTIELQRKFPNQWKITTRRKNVNMEKTPKIRRNRCIHVLKKFVLFEIERIVKLNFIIEFNFNGE